MTVDELFVCFTGKTLSIYSEDDAYRLLGFLKSLECAVLSALCELDEEDEEDE